MSSSQPLAFMADTSGTGTDMAQISTQNVQATKTALPGLRRIQMALPMTSPSGSTHGPSLLALNSSPSQSPHGGGVVGAAAPL